MTEITFAGHDGARWEVEIEEYGIMEYARIRRFFGECGMDELSFPVADLDTLIDKLDELRREAGKNAAKCEGCNAPATKIDSEGVDLCEQCYAEMLADGGND